MEGKVFRGSRTYEVIGQDTSHEGIPAQFYYARAQETGQRFTIAVTGEQQSAAGNQRLLQRAGRILGTVDSVHIIKAHDIGQDDDRIFLVLEDLQGNLLSKWVSLRPGQVDEYTALSFLHQLAIALKDMERLQIAHGYLKPTSIYVSPDPAVREGEILKIWDLMLSAVDDSNIAFQAPETLDAIGGAEIRDIRTDIYSIGAIGYWLLAKRAPLEANSLGGLARIIVSKDEQDRAPSLANIRGDLSTECVKLIMKCIEKDIGRRYANTTELITEIDILIGKQSNSAAYLMHRVRQADGQGDWTEVLKLAERAEQHPGMVRQLQGVVKKAQQMLAEQSLTRFTELMTRASAAITANRLEEAAGMLQDAEQLLKSDSYIQPKQKTEQLMQVRRLQTELREQKRFRPAYLASSSGREYALETLQVTIGRNRPEVANRADFIDLKEEPGKGTVSREHATFLFEEGQWKVTHHSKATNRTYVDAERVADNQKVVIPDNALMKFGRVELRFHLR